MMKKIAALFVLCLVGCRSVPFERYAGEQRPWPVAIGSLYHVRSGVPFYRGFPDRPYVLIGTVDGRDISERSLVALAKKEHADAVLILDRREVIEYRQKGGFAVKNFYMPNHVEEEKVELINACLIRFSERLKEDSPTDL